MYAIVDIAGKQFKVEKNKFLYAPLMDAEAGTSLKFLSGAPSRTMMEK